MTDIQVSSNNINANDNANPDDYSVKADNLTEPVNSKPLKPTNKSVTLYDKIRQSSEIENYL